MGQALSRSESREVAFRLIFALGNGTANDQDAWEIALDGKTAPAEVKVVRQEKHRTVVEITIHEGKNRQVRRMFKAVKNPVLELKRINVGGLTLKGVGSGEIRSLTDEELQKLTQRLGMHRGKNSQSK